VAPVPGQEVDGGASATIGAPAECGHSYAMPNIKQQEKRVRIATRQRLENLRYRSTIKTLAKRLETAVTDGDEGAVAAEHTALVQTIDKAAAKGAIHKNTAARRKAQAARVVARVDR
jgi:small subunit ribosomal protein S20